MGGHWLEGVLALDRDGDTFTAPEPAGSNQDGRLFGGLVAAQCLAAACATVDDAAKRPQSLHAYFVRGGRPETDVTLLVDRIRDGRSFATRRVSATQHGEVIFELLASFHAVEPGADEHPPQPPVRPVAECPEVVGFGPTDRFEMRSTGDEGVFTGPPHWVRMRDPIGDDPVLRACALTFMSDMGLMAAARPPGTPLRFGQGFQAASLDHAIWFHRPFDPARWHCYQAAPVNNSGSLGLALGGFYTEEGTLVASMAQEALWRLGRSSG